MPRVLDVRFSPDDRIGNYRVEHELGPTGSGILVQARHQVLPRRAIIKVVHAAFAGVSPYLVQTLREACILEAIGHPGVPAVYESGLLRDRRPWFAFEVISGPTLEELLAPGALAAGDVARLLRDLADILQAAHRRGVIHRGLRPDRIVITGQRRYPLCIPDWSEAVAHDASACAAPPDGLPGYVAPELVHQDAGSAERVDDRADMFALGAIAYRALIGAPPFGASGDGGRYAPVLSRCPDAPRELAAIIDALLSFDRFDRPSASEVRGDVDWLLGTLPDLQPPVAPVERRRAPLVLPPLAAPPVAAAPVAAAPVAATPVAATPIAAVPRELPRVRRPRWTPNVQYVETTDVDIVISDDDRQTH